MHSMVKSNSCNFDFNMCSSLVFSSNSNRRCGSSDMILNFQISSSHFIIGIVRTVNTEELRNYMVEDKWRIQIGGRREKFTRANNNYTRQLNKY